MAFDTSQINNLPEGLDPKIVKQTYQGKAWGEQDQKRYDVATGKRKTGKQVRDMRKEGGWVGTHEKLQEHQNQGGTLGGNAQKQFDRMDQRVENRAEAKDRANQYQAAVMPKGQDPRYINNRSPQQNQASQNVNQNNDINSTVNGNDNYVYNNQDNSIRNYGGDNRSFVYNSNGEGPDTPATMATLAGYYAPDDSPAATAKRLDQNVTMNRDNQKKYANTSHIAEGAIKRAEQNSYIDPKALDKRIHDRSQYHMAESTIQGANIFGDIFGMEGPTWNSSKPAKPVEKPDFDKMYDTYTDF